MSSRALRKLGKKNDFPSMAAEDQMEEEDSDTGENNDQQVANKKNIFQLLRTSNDESSPESDLEKDGMHDKHPEKTVTEKNGISSLDSANQVKKKKKKAKKKKQAKANQGEEEKIKSDDISEDEIDKSVREVNQLLGITTVGNSSGSGSSSIELNSKALLGVEHRNLNADNEMRKKFGANVVAADRRRNPHARIQTRSSWLVPQRPGWKPASKSGISMKLTENKNGICYFVFEHSPTYQKIQFKFLEAVESLDHNNIVSLLNNNPNHIDSILQLSEVCKMNEDHQMAAELIERALFVYERSFHTLFSVARANCRLDYRQTENRSFFLALFRHMIFLGDRACYRTALEFCKLILGLDPEDQLAILLLIDYYSIKAEEYDYLLRIYDEWEATKNLLQLPNFAYSVPLAMFYCQKYSNEEASKLMQDALIKFPTVLLPMMDKGGVMLSDDIMKHDYFQRTNDVKNSQGLNRLIALYVGRCFILWKVPEVLDWLASCAKGAIERIESQDPLCVKWGKLWKTLYQRVPLNIYRHIVVSDIKEASRTLPPEISHRIIRTYDPLPPEDSVSGYTIPERRQEQPTGDGFLPLFIRSLLPSYGLEQQPNRGNAPAQREQRPEPQGAEAAERPGLGEEVADSAQRLMGAMRELLNSMTYRGDLDPAREEENLEQDWEEGELE